MKKHIIILTLLLFTFPLLKGQDIHFSQFYFSPLNLNPAQTGFFNGTQRLALNYRNQWKLAAGGFPYVTYSASFDMHILDNAMTASDIMGVGITAYSDKAGTGHLAKQGVLASLAYNRDLTGKGMHIMGLGIQGGIIQMGFDPNELRFGNDILSGNPNSKGGSGQEIFQNNLSYIDINAGALWNFIPTETIKIYLGVSTYHLTKPSENFQDVGLKNDLSSRISVQAGASITATKEWDVLPSILFMRQDASNITNFGTAVRYNTPSMSIRLGAWYRYWGNSDAVIFMMGMEFYDFTLGISYDINVSSLKETSNGKGSFEVALIYILYLKKNVRRDIQCPEF